MPINYTILALDRQLLKAHYQLQMKNEIGEYLPTLHGFLLMRPNNYTQAKNILNFRLIILFLQSMLQPLICVFHFFSGLILDQQKPV